MSTNISLLLYKNSFISITAYINAKVGIHTPYHSEEFACYHKLLGSGLCNALENTSFQKNRHFQHI